MNTLNSFKLALFAMFAILGIVLATPAFSAADIEINTPAITAIRASMKAQHQQLKPHYESGAIGQCQWSSGMGKRNPQYLRPALDQQGQARLVGAGCRWRLGEEIISGFMNS